MTKSIGSRIRTFDLYRNQPPWMICITGCAKKVTPFWYLSFLPLLDALFAIFVYLHIIFIKCLITEPSVVSIYRWTPAGWRTIAHFEQHDKLPQKGECFIHRASEPQMWPANSPDLNPVDYAVWVLFSSKSRLSSI